MTDCICIGFDSINSIDAGLGVSGLEGFDELGKSSGVGFEVSGLEGFDEEISDIFPPGISDALVCMTFVVDNSGVVGNLDLVCNF